MSEDVLVDSFYKANVIVAQDKFPGDLMKQLAYIKENSVPQEYLLALVDLTQPCFAEPNLFCEKVSLELPEVYSLLQGLEKAVSTLQKEQMVFSIEAQMILNEVLEPMIFRFLKEIGIES